MKAFPKMSREEVDKMMGDIGNDLVFVNNLYQVNVRKVEPVGDNPPMLHLSIKRRDKDRIGPEKYRHFMRIKDELCGEDAEACEIYPSRRREVDTANQYHLWVLPEGTPFPFGFFPEQRTVYGESDGGSRQHPFDKDGK